MFHAYAEKNAVINTSDTCIKVCIELLRSGVHINSIAVVVAL